MLFNSYIFVLWFLPFCLLGYFGLNYLKCYKFSQLFLLLMSLWFYGYFNPAYLAIIVTSIVINYTISLLFFSINQEISRKILLIVALILNIGILFYFKYYDFFMSNVSQLLDTQYTLKNIVLPLGISFFTFQQISYVIDCYRKEIPKYDFLHYASFVTYFPQLIAGPIVTHDELVPQFMDISKKTINWDNMACGVFMFSLGLAKKVLLADVFGVAANWGFSNIGSLDSTNGLLTMLSYTFQIYFDFSGYCDMAIGLAKMMNIDIPLNFNSPYKASTIGDFWDRWHITLTRFFTKYVYIPLGGSRKGAFRTYVNILIVFFISGIWHGANWTFILWGCLHGVASVIYKALKHHIDKLPRQVNWLATFLFINLTWVLFRADSVGLAFSFMEKLCALNFAPISKSLIKAFTQPELVFMLKYTPLYHIQGKILMAGYFSLATVLTFGTKSAYCKMCTFRPTVINMLASAILLVWCILSFSGVSTFLYFNF